MKHIKTENPDGMFPVECSEASVKEASPLLAQLFAPDPLNDRLARLIDLAETFASVDEMPNQFTLDAKRLVSLLADIPIFVERGDAANAVLIAMEIGDLARKLSDEATFGPDVERVNSTTRKLLAAAAERCHPDEKREAALRRFDELRAAKPGRKLGTITSQVCKEMDVPPRTLDEWRSRSKK
jgi:hypothetical protein